ncbi:MAG TPA: hypothetical protein VJT31_24750 [Rugosimonospora sp.]|nr:hypothetical protein [Rugosimonospora sp.]
MDHHDDWGHWGEEHGDDHAGLGDADTADLGGDETLHDLGHHDGLDDPPPPEDLGHDDTSGYAHDAPGPDLVHEGGDGYGDEPWPAHDETPVHDPLPGEEPFTDPDLAGHEPTGYEPDFPPPLELEHPPEPVDGYPWSDPASLGHAPATGPDPYGVTGAAHPDELAAYAGLAPSGGDGWAALLGSDDPATSTLARWWGPPG